MSQASKYREASRSISDVERGKKQTDTALSVLGAMTLGVLGAAQPTIDALIEKRKAALRVLLIEDFKQGALTESEVIAEDALASFVIRIFRAAIEGTAISKLRMMSDYFKRAAPKKGYSDDNFQTTAAIIEGLTDDELRALAVIATSIKNGKLSRPSVVQAAPHGSANPPSSVIDGETMDITRLFASFEPFRSATMALIRFGFVELSSAFGANIIHATERLFDFLEEVDIEKY